MGVVPQARNELPAPAAAAGAAPGIAAAGRGVTASYAPAEGNEPWLERTLRGDRDGRFAAISWVCGRGQIVTGSHDGSLTLWPLGTSMGTTLASKHSRPMRLGCHDGPVTCVKVSASGGLVVSASADRSVGIWQNQVGKQAPVFIKAHFAPARACDLSLDQRLLLSASDDKTVKLWSLPDRRFVASLVGHTHWVRSAVFSKSSRLVVSGGDDRSVRLWDLQKSNSQRSAWFDNAGAVTCVRFDPQETAVASCSWDSAINVWDLETETLRQHYDRAHGSAPILQIEFHPSRELLLSASQDKTLRVWDLRHGRLMYTVSGHARPVRSCAWEGDGDRFASCDDQAVHIWALPAAASVAPARPSRRPSPSVVPPHVACHRAVAPALSPSSAFISRDGGCGAFADHGSAAERSSSAPAGSTAAVAFDRRSRLGWPGAQSLPGGPLASAQRQAAWTGDSPSLPSASEVATLLPESLARAVEQMVTQMGVLSQSLQSFEARLARTEACVLDLSCNARAKGVFVQSGTAQQGLSVISSPTCESQSASTLSGVIEQSPELQPSARGSAPFSDRSAAGTAVLTIDSPITFLREENFDLASAGHVVHLEGFGAGVDFDDPQTERLAGKLREVLLQDLIKPDTIAWDGRFALAEDSFTWLIPQLAEATGAKLAVFVRDTQEDRARVMRGWGTSSLPISAYLCIDLPGNGQADGVIGIERTRSRHVVCFGGCEAIADRFSRTSEQVAFYYLAATRLRGEAARRDHESAGGANSREGCALSALHAANLIHVA